MRLEDMDSLFGDATTAVGTPATGTPALRAESDALVTPGSPVPQLDIRGRPRFGAASAISGLNINPPDVVDPKPQPVSRDAGGGIGGWLLRMMGRGSSDRSSRRAEYTPLEQGGD